MGLRTKTKSFLARATKFNNEVTLTGAGPIPPYRGDCRTIWVEPGQRLTSEEDVDKTTLETSEEDVDKTTLETSEEDVDKTTLETSEEDAEKTTLETSEEDVDKTTLETSEEDVDKTTLETSESYALQP